MERSLKNKTSDWFTSLVYDSLVSHIKMVMVVLMAPFPSFGLTVNPRTQHSSHLSLSLTQRDIYFYTQTESDLRKRKEKREDVEVTSEREGTDDVVVVV